MAARAWKNRILTPLQFLLSIALFAEAAVILGVAAFPALKLFQWAQGLPLGGNLRLLVLGVALGAGFGQLKAAVLTTVVSGTLLLALDLAKGSSALHHASGAAVLLKLGLLGLGNLFPQSRLAWYLAATAVASVGSHMPGTWRHFSLLDWKVVSPD